MKNINYSLLIYLLFPVLAWGIIPEGKYKKEKLIQQSFAVDNRQAVYINNTYGNVNIISWDKNIVEIKVGISVDGNDEDAVDARLKSIRIEIDKDVNEIMAKTHIDKVKTSWSLISLFTGKSHHTNFKINYEVHIPLNSNLRLVNDYGNVFINRLEGKLNLNVDYGKFEIGELLHADNHIQADYLSLSVIDFIDSGYIDADYSKININVAHELNLKCDYTTININEIRRINFNNDYGGIHIDKVKEVEGTGDYQSRYFGEVNSVDFNGDYGSLTIKGLLLGFEKSKLTCDYTTIRIENDYQVPYRLQIYQEYGCFKYSDLTILREMQKDADKKIEAFYKDPDATSLIKINEDYGCIKIYN